MELCKKQKIRGCSSRSHYHKCASSFLLSWPGIIIRTLFVGYLGFFFFFVVSSPHSTKCVVCVSLDKSSQSSVIPFESQRKLSTCGFYCKILQNPILLFASWAREYTAAWEEKNRIWCECVSVGVCVCVICFCSRCFNLTLRNGAAHF